MEKVFDCAIIGGGLAGLCLANQLADTGYQVILFEKEKYPFHKVCGEYISMESYDFLERIGIPLSTLGLPIINTIKISAPNGTYLERPLDLGGFGISRFTLDSMLAQLALKKGVTLLEQTKVFDVQFMSDSFSIKTNTATYLAKITCAANGKYAFLKKELKPSSALSSKNYVAVKYHVQLDLPDNHIELHNFSDGYCGVSKVDGNKYCLCYLTDAKNLKASGNIAEMEQKVLMKNPFLKNYFDQAVFLYNKPITISQITFSKKEAVSNHILMLGDAAGTIAPLCGNGMSMAMHSSFIAFKLIEKQLSGEIPRLELEHLYKKQWNMLFSGRIRAGQLIQGLFGKSWLTNGSVSLLKKLPWVTDKLIKVTHGKRF